MEEILTRLGEIRSELDGLLAKDALTETEETRYSELAAEFDTLESKRVKLIEREEKRAAILKAIADPRNVISGDDRSDPLGQPASVKEDRKLWDLDTVRTALRSGDTDELRSRALSAIEKAPMPDRHKKGATELVDGFAFADSDDPTVSKVYSHIVTVSSPEYLRAWSRAFRAAVKGGTDPEALQVLSRAMSLTDASGGFAVPLPIDPTLVKNYDVDVNPFRAISNQVTITTDVLRTVNSTAVAASWDGEAAEASDDASTFANIDITVHKAQAFVPFSVEIQGDYPNFTSTIGSLLADARDDLEAAAFATGTGTNQPIGIVTALTGTAFEFTSNTTDVFALSDVYDLEEELSAQARARASWVANKRIYQAIREAGGANLDDFWANLGQGQPPQLLGYRAYESSAMDGVIDALADNRVLILGDFSAYWIVDRVGLSIELVPHMFATANNRPSGQRGFYAWWRVGADSVNDRRFSMLNVT